MKTPTMSELQNRIKEIESDMIDNWGDWGDVNPVSRLMTIRKLARIRRALSKPVRVDFSTGMKRLRQSNALKFWRKR